MAMSETFFEELKRHVRFDRNEMELAIMLETRREAFIEKVQFLERLEEANLERRLAVTSAQYDEVVEEGEAWISTINASASQTRLAGWSRTSSGSRERRPCASSAEICVPFARDTIGNRARYREEMKQGSLNPGFPEDAPISEPSWPITGRGGRGSESFW